MKSLLIFLTAFFYLAVISLKAQKDASSKKAFFKNEIMLDISPLIRWAITTSDGPESVAFGYRRYLNDRHAIRMSYRSSFYNSTNSIDNYYGYRQLTPFTIEFYSLKSFENTKENLHSLRTGYEFHYGKRRVRGIIGLEMINGISVNEYIQSLFIEETSLIGNLFSSTANLIDVSDEEAQSGFINGNNYRILSYAIGIAPIIGFKIKMSNKWYFNASMILDMYYQIPYTTRIYSGNEYNNQKGFRFFSDAPLADISICYRFGNK